MPDDALLALAQRTRDLQAALQDLPVLLAYAGDPNGFLSAQESTLCWDSINHALYANTSTGSGADWTRIASSTGGGGAPDSASYLTLAFHTGLSGERRFVPAARLAATDGGANADYTLDLATTGVAAGTYGSATQVPQITTDAYGRLTAASAVTISGVSPSAHNLLDATYHGDAATGSIARGDLLYGNATPKIARLPLGGITGSILTRDANDVAWSAYALVGTAGKTYTLSATGGTVPIGTGTAGHIAEWATTSTLQAATLAKTGAGLLTMSSAGDYTLTVPATGTAAVGAGTLGVATTNDVTGNAHTHAMAFSSNPGAAASLLASDANGYLQLKRLGINTAPEYCLDVNGDIRIPYTGAIRLGSSAWPSNILINYAWDATFYDQIKFYVPQPGATATIPRMILHNSGVAFNAATRYSSSSSMEIFGVTSHVNVYILAKPVSGVTTNTALYFVPTQSDTTVGTNTIQYGLDTTASYGNFLVFASAKSGSARTYFTQTGAVGFNTYTPGGHLQLNNPNADTVATIIQAAASQTADLSRWQSSAGVVNAKVAANFSATFKLTDTATNVVGTALTLGHNSSSTPAAGFGNALLFTLASSTTADQSAGRLRALWYDATHATRQGDVVLSAYDYNGEREGLRVRANGSAPAIAFYGGTPRTRAAALTAQLTTITHTAPTTPDYAIQDFVDVAGDGSKGYAFASKDEANTLLAVIANLQARVQELENALNAATGVNLIA